jgi:arylsulfatase
MAGRPNILFFHVDNLGFGELSCYSGGPFRGAVISRIDAFAADGFRLTNYCPESQCTPTRSALLTGRHAIRSGGAQRAARVSWRLGPGRLGEDAG